MPRTGPPRVPADLVLRIGIAAAWLVFGVVFKILDLVPRHRLIVARVVGEAAARPLTIAIGVAEVLIAVWVLSGRRARACAIVQTLAIVTMNALELTLARDLLLAPVPMVCANAALLAAAWYLALKSTPTARAA